MKTPQKSRHEEGGKALRWWQTIVRGESKSFWARSIQKAAHVGSRGYAAGVKWREKAYANGWLRTKKLPCPTICIGNLTVGGTGKTPLVIRLAEDLKSRGLRPAVLLRGYRRERNDSKPLLVRDAKQIYAGVADAGDEALEIAQRLPGVCVAVGADRYKVGKAVLAHEKVDCFILDDGFQHHRLMRDFNVVAIDVTDPWGGGRLLPAGLLREPPEGLSRAQIVVLTRTPSAAPDRLAILRAEVRSLMKEGATLLESRHEPVSLLAVADGKTHPLTRLRNCPVLAVSGIGNPVAFESALENLGARMIGCLRHQDHGGKAADVWEWAMRRYQENALVVMTEKDAVRWGSEPIPAAFVDSVMALRVSVLFSQGENAWMHLIDLVQAAAGRPVGL